MSNIHLIVNLGDGCTVVGKLVSVEQTLPMPPVPGCPIHKLPEPSCRMSVLTDSMGTLDFNARHVAKIGTDKDHMVDIKAPGDVMIYVASLLDKVESSVEQLLKKACDG